MLGNVSQIGEQSVSRPFPQELTFGKCIKPNNVDQKELNAEIQKRYDAYKAHYLRSEHGYSYIEAGGNGEGGDTAKTISEAHGYGMIITVLMAGHDRDAKVTFDEMNALRKQHPSKTNSSLMSWTVYTPGTASHPQDAATDGDFDNAYALLLAYDQWGDQAYLDDAKHLLAAIKESEMGKLTHRTLLGDWDSSSHQTNTRSSDWMTAHMRAFYTATDDGFWLQAASTVYFLVNEVADKTTGLVPCFITGSPAVPDPTGGGTGEDYADTYYYNAARFPWRIAADYAHHGTPEAKQAIDTISNWVKGKYPSPADIRSGYELNGNTLDTSLFDLVFVAPFAAGMIANSANQNYLNNLWAIIAHTDTDSAYSEALRILSILLISGNWWAPKGASDN